MIDKMLIEYCSPTLAGLKTANLFSYSFSSDEELNINISNWNRELNSKGIELFALRKRSNNALIYVYRMSKLKRDLSKRGAVEFLSGYGYQEFSVLCCIDKLKERLLYLEEFPHEIGLFLGYPLEDVKGFIENAGLNSKCTGCWKVYCNECEAILLFKKFQKCKEVYTKLFENRIRSIVQLTVAV